MVSMHIVSSWGKDIGDKIKESLPPNTKILKQNDNFDTASLEVLIYNESFKKIGDGCPIPRTVLDINLGDAKNAPSIIQLRN